MTKKSQTTADPFALPEGQECPSYIPVTWRASAVQALSLVIDVDDNVKLHADKDLAAQQESLKSWGFTRQVIVRRANRQVVIGNGSVLASIRNGWEYVPVDFRDLTEQQAKALGAADNMLGTVADWNQAAIEKLLNDLPSFELPEFSLDLGQLCGDVLAKLPPIEAVLAKLDGQGDESCAEAQPTGLATTGKPRQISLNHSVIVKCKSEQDQIGLMSRLLNEGYDCRVSTVRAD